jgi:hypothetical protein
LNVQIMEMAASLAFSESADLHVVHAWESFSEMASGFSTSLYGTSRSTVMWRGTPSTICDH